MFMTKPYFHFFGISIFIAAFTSGCGILFTDVKPVAEKSDYYHVMMLSDESSDWMKIEDNSTSDKKNSGKKSEDEDDSTDLAFQSKKTASIISLNSACRRRNENENKTLEGFSDLLLLGINHLQIVDRKEVKVQNVPALMTQAEGDINGEMMTLKTIVLRKGACVYDLMYVSRPEHFQLHDKDFARFVASLRLD